MVRARARALTLTLDDADVVPGTVTYDSNVPASGSKYIYGAQAGNGPSNGGGGSTAHGDGKTGARAPGGGTPGSVGYEIAFQTNNW